MLGACPVAQERAAQHSAAIRPGASTGLLHAASHAPLVRRPLPFLPRLLPLAPNLGANLDVTSIDRAFQVARRGREEEKSDGRDAWRGKEGWPGTYCVVHMRTPSHADILLRCGRRWAIICSVKYCASANLRKSSRALPAPNLKSRAIVQSVPSA